MAQSRRRSTPKPASAPAPTPRGEASGWRSAIAALRPELSRRGALRLGTRTAIASGVIGILAVLATWSASGFLDRGGLGRLIHMKNTPDRPPADAAAQRGRLDRGRLNSVITATGKAPP